jgi:Ca2+-binding RTX toxin-like protein
MRLARIHPTAPRSNRCSTGPVIEALEPRRCLSVTLQDGLLVCHGTGGNDYILVTRNAYDSTKVIVIDGDNYPYPQFERAAVKGVVMYGGDGNDRLGAQFARGWDIPMTLFGGAGDDSLLGGAANDSLVGGDGEDFLDGQSYWGDSYVPETDAPSMVVGGDTLVHADGPDTLLGEAASDPVDEFHGEIAYNESFAYHNGVLRISLPLDCHEFMLLPSSYPLPVVDVNNGYYTCGAGMPVAFDIYLSKRVPHEEFDGVAAEYGIPVVYHFYEDGERPGVPLVAQPVTADSGDGDAGSQDGPSANSDITAESAPLPVVPVPSSPIFSTTTLKRAWEELDAVDLA